MYRATVLHMHRPRFGVAARIHDLLQTAVITVLTKSILIYIYVYVAVVCAFQHVLCRYAATRVRLRTRVGRGGTAACSFPQTAVMIII